MKKRLSRIRIKLVAGALFGIFAAQFVFATEHFVNMTPSYSFDPANLSIDVGDIVTWYNQDLDDHDVTSDTGAWVTFFVASGESGSLQFISAGDFPYRDSLYWQLGMTGSITVQNVVPPTLSAPLRPNNSQFQFTISGTAGKTYVIEVSSTLTNWTAIATNIAPANTFNYTNSSATNRTQFYRVKDSS